MTTRVVTPEAVLTWLRAACGWPNVDITMSWGDVDAVVRGRAILRMECLVNGELPSDMLDSLVTVEDFCHFAAMRCESSRTSLSDDEPPSAMLGPQRQ